MEAVVGEAPAREPEPGGQHDVVPFLPLDMGQALMDTQAAPYLFSPWTGFLVLAGYTAAVLAVALVLLVRRDA